MRNTNVALRSLMWQIKQALSKGEEAARDHIRLLPRRIHQIHPVTDTITLAPETFPERQLFEILYIQARGRQLLQQRSNVADHLYTSACHIDVRIAYRLTHLRLL